MANRKKTFEDKNESSPQKIPGGPETPSSMDDSASDEERLKQDASYIIIPDVTDIPGQEHITNAGPLGEMADTTASSDDEEGIQNEKDLLDDDVEIIMGTEADVTKDDLELLNGFDEPIVDETDSEGEKLNEANEEDDLDVPGAEADDEEESVGEEDEENNFYSLGSADNDNITEGTP